MLCAQCFSWPIHCPVISLCPLLFAPCSFLVSCAMRHAPFLCFNAMRFALRSAIHAMRYVFKRA